MGITIVALFTIHVIAGKREDSDRRTCKENGGTCLSRCKAKDRAVTPSVCPTGKHCCLKPSGRNINGKDAKPRDKKENVKIGRIGKKVKEDKKGKQAKKLGRKENGKQGRKGKTVKGKTKGNKRKNEKVGKKNGKKYIPTKFSKNINGNKQGKKKKRRAQNCRKA